MNWEIVNDWAGGTDKYLFITLSVLVCAVFMWIGAQLARVQRGNLLRALAAAVLSTAVVWAVKYGLTSILPMAGSILGFFIGFILALLIVKVIFDASLPRALVVWFFFLLAQPVVIFFLGRPFFGDLENFFWRGWPF